VCAFYMRTRAKLAVLLGFLRKLWGNGKLILNLRRLCAVVDAGLYRAHNRDGIEGLRDDALKP